MEPFDPGRSVGFLQAALEADPGFRPALRALAEWCARQISGRTGAQERARRLLAESLNPELQKEAARSLYRESLRAKEAGEAARLEGDARRCFARARAFVPGLSEQDVLPAWRGQHEPEDPPGTDSTGAVRDVLLAGWRNLRRLPVEVFPGLPETVAGTLKRMGCRIPQPDERPHLPGPHNLIRGRFIDPGKESWAALCCVQGTARLLVFRDAEDTQPETLGGGLELWWMPSSGPSSAEFSWLITVAEARLNRRYHEPCGGVPLPPLDHDGIELHFLGKASVILSWHTGRWLSLQGAD